MDFEKNKIKNYFLYDTPVENLFIGEYMLDAPGDYVKVYLLAMMHMQVDDAVDNMALAKALNLPYDAVDKAWDYWQSVGLVRKVAKAEGSDAYKVLFVNLKEAAFGKCAIELVDANKVQQKDAIDLSSVDLGQLYRNIEKTTGRMMDGKEAETIAEWLTDFNIRPEVILYCYKYSTENGKSNRVRYVEKILMDWREKNLDTVALVEEYLGESDKAFRLYKRVFKALGFDGRKPTEPEKEIMRKWFFEMNLSIDDVLTAISKTTSSYAPNIKYVDSIIAQSRAIETDKTDAESAYAKVQAQYETIREENAKKTKDIRQRIFTEIPEVENIMAQLRSCSSDAIAAMLSRNVSEQKAVEQKRKELNLKKEKMLRDVGYAPNALDPIYSCSKCKDTGLLDDGTTTCSCYAEKLEIFINGRSFK